MGSSKKTCMKQMQVQDSRDDHKRVLDHFLEVAKPPPASPELLSGSNKTQRSQGTFWFFLGSTLFKNSFSRQATGKKKNALQSSRDGLILPTPGADFGVLTSTCTAW